MGPPARKARPHLALEYFEISSSPGAMQSDIVIHFLKGCVPKLQTVRGTPFTWHKVNVAVLQALSSIGFVWTALRQDNLSLYEADSNVATTIAHSPWSVIEAYTRWFGPMAVKALVENCDNLTVLNIMEPRNTALTGAHMQTILSKAKNLKSLQVHWLLSAQKISATDILASQWVTTALEHIDFKIHVPRIFDEDMTEEDDQAAAIETSRNIQRQLLRRLGQQIHLKNLIVGGKITPARSSLFEHQRNCFEFTLGSGLDELKDLKKLKMLDIHHMDHPVLECRS